MKHRIVFLMALLFVVSGFAGARAEEKSYEVQKTEPRASVGVEAKASVTVLGRNGWHVNEEAPITASVKGDQGVNLPKPKLVRADLAQSSKQSARFDIPFSASTAGRKTITVETRFVMCQEQACKPVKETVAMQVNVEAASPPAASKKN